MRHPHSSITVAIMFVAIAVMFSLVFFPEVSMAAKLAFFAAGIGCGVAIARSRRRSSDEGRS